MFDIFGLMFDITTIDNESRHAIAASFVASCHSLYNWRFRCKLLVIPFTAYDFLFT